MLDAQLPSRREQRDDTDDAAAEQIARQDEHATRETVGDSSAEQQEGDAGCGVDAHSDAELERRRAQCEELEGQRDAPDGVAKAGYGLAGPEQPEVAMPQRNNDLRPAHAARA